MGRSVSEEAKDLLDGMPFVRRLVHHEESDILFEIKTDVEWESCAENGCDDVTDIEEFEAAFNDREREKVKSEENDPEIKLN